ncbi:MAG: MFS transporter [Smithellaceae bacterium]|jgi:MFS family permease
MEKPLSPHYRWYIFALCAGIFIISQFWRVSNAVVANELIHDLGLSPETLGLLGGAFFYSFCLVQLPMGSLLDHFRPRAVMSTLACIGAASAVIFALSGSAATAILARAGIGIGMAAALMGSYKIFTTWFSPYEFATLSGIMIALGNLGAMSATAPLALLSEILGWRGAFLCMAIVTLLLASAIYLVVRDHPDWQASGRLLTPLSMSGIFSGLLTVLGNSRFWYLAQLSFASYGVMTTLLGLWGGPYLMHVYGLSKANAGVSSTLLYVQVKETFPLSMAGTALTALNFFLMLGGAVFQHMMGIIMGHWSPSATGALPVVAYQWGFGVCVALLALALIAYIGSQDITPESAAS